MQRDNAVHAPVHTQAALGLVFVGLMLLPMWKQQQEESRKQTMRGARSCSARGEGAS